ncbi:MAG: hypothetical protein Lokiarch_38620, partial [Candidatus Lokiarchaeum sp. GC14_75]
YDKLMGGTLPNIIGGSDAGVYAKIQFETEKHLFKGDLLLAPSGISKTSPLGLKNKPISLNYITQKGSYVIYSDFNDPRLAAHITSSSDQDLPYMQNSMMYLENTISKQSSGEYDTIYPYMMYLEGVFLPTFQFAGAGSKYPIPEFFHDYPVIIDQESYEKLEYEYSTIYKVIESNSPQAIRLIPKDSRDHIYGEIDHIIVTFKDSMGNENYQELTFRASEDMFTFNSTTSILTLSPWMYSVLQEQFIHLKLQHSSVQNYEAYSIFEINIEKYRSINNLNGITQEGLDHIATMQAIEQNILEYTYQYQNAQNTQQGLSEMFYTVFITTISTLITVGITYGIGVLTAPTPDVALNFAGLRFVDPLINDVAIKTFMSTLIARIGRPAALAIATSPIGESIQEIFVDPYIDLVVSEIVRSVGLGVTWQVFASSLVEGGREGITGPLSQFLFGGTQINTQGLIETQHLYQGISEQMAVENAIQTKEYTLKYTPQWSSIIKSGASLILGAALIGIGGPMFFGASLVTRFSALQSISKDFKLQQIIIHNFVSQKLPSHFYSSTGAVQFSQAIKNLLNKQLGGFANPEGIVQPSQVAGAAVLPNSDLLTAMKKVFTAWSMFNNRLIRYNDRKVSLDAYNRFTSRLKDKLYEIFRFDFIDTLLADFFETSETYFINTRYQIRKGKLKGIVVNFLFDLLSIAKLKIYQKSVFEGEDNFDDILDILDIFKEYYETPIYQPVTNPNYLPLLTLSRSLALIFSKARIIDKQSVRLFEKKFKVAFSATLSSIRSDSSQGIRPSKYAELFSRLKSKYSIDLKAHNVYEPFIEAFDIFFASISTDDLVPLEIQNIPRGKLISQLISLFPQGSIKSRPILSLLLTNHRYNLFKTFFGKRVYASPALETLSNLNQNIEDLTVLSFEKITQYPINKDDLSSIQRRASQVIRDFIEVHTSDTEPEILARGYMEYIFNAKFEKYHKGSLKWLKGVGGLLELDGYSEILKIAFEYNGPQHYSLEFYMNVYKLSRDVALKRLQRQQQNDNLKMDLCKEKGINLIVIPFDVKYRDLQEYISEEYKRLIGKEPPQKKSKNYREILDSFLGDIQ